MGRKPSPQSTLHSQQQQQQQQRQQQQQQRQQQHPPVCMSVPCQSVCLCVWSGHIRPSWLPCDSPRPLCQEEGRKEGPVVTQEGGFGEREGGSVKGCLSWSWSTPLEPLTIEGLFGQGQGQAQVCVSACVCVYGCAPSSSQRGRELRSVVFIDGSTDNIQHIIPAGCKLVGDVRWCMCVSVCACVCGVWLSASVHQRVTAYLSGNSTESSCSVTALNMEGLAPLSLHILYISARTYARQHTNTHPFLCEKSRTRKGAVAHLCDVTTAWRVTSLILLTVISKATYDECQCHHAVSAKGKIEV